MNKIIQLAFLLILSVGISFAQGSFQSSVKPLPVVGKENATKLKLNPKKTQAYINIYTNTDIKLKAIEAENVGPNIKKQKTQQAINDGESQIKSLLNPQEYEAHQALVKENVKEAKAAVKADMAQFIENELNLSEEQKMQVTIVLAEQAQKEKNLKGNPQQIKAQKNILALESLKKLDKILNKEQKDKLLQALTR
jgi:hypothetical protein